MKSYTKCYIKKLFYVLFLISTHCLSNDDKIGSILTRHIGFIENIIENYTLSQYLPSKKYESYEEQISFEKTMIEHYEKYLRFTNSGFLPINHDTQTALASTLLTLLLETKGLCSEEISHYLINKKIHPITLRLTFHFFLKELQQISCYLFKDQQEIDMFFAKAISMIQNLNEYCISLLNRQLLEWNHRSPHSSINLFKKTPMYLSSSS